VHPEIVRLSKELARGEHVNKYSDDVLKRDGDRKSRLMTQAGTIRHRNYNTGLRLRQAQEVLLRSILEPRRINKQAECVSKAVGKVRCEILRLAGKIRSCEDSLCREANKRKQAKEIRAKLYDKLQLQRDTVEHRNHDAQLLQHNLGVERFKFTQLRQVLSRTHAQLRDVEAKCEQAVDNTMKAKRVVAVLSRKRKKKQVISQSMSDMLPAIAAQLADAEHLKRARWEVNQQLGNNTGNLKQEVNLSVAKLLAQDGLQEAQRDSLELLLRDVSYMEREVASWSAETSRQARLISILTTQCAMMSRDAAKARASEEDVRQQVRVKDLTILDLAKKNNELDNRLNEFSALYDVLKDERSKYVHFIQSSTQALAEMKEKSKILVSEIDILRCESRAKDKALSKECAQHVASQMDRNHLRMEHHKAQSEHRSKQVIVEQQITEIDKLNCVIGHMECQMLKFKRQYENAVELRNDTGVALIDRNDEMCILHEKLHLQALTLNEGELAMRRLDIDSRMMRLWLTSIQRQIRATRKSSPTLTNLAHLVVRLQHHLELQEAASLSLCEALESPSKDGRWRRRHGDDLSDDQLASKADVLSGHLLKIKSEALETDLVSEEAASLTNSLRRKTDHRRACTLSLTRKLVVVKSAMRNVTRVIHGVVAELSMYQATAARLNQQMKLARVQLTVANERITQGIAPDGDSRVFLGMQIDEQAQGLAEIAADDVTSHRCLPTYTSAEPRPNAYVPDSAGLGIAKPYGRFSPFKPSDPGSSMRHIRPPSTMPVIM